MASLQANQQNLTDTGYFRANITSSATARPLKGVTIQISDINDTGNIIEEITTDENGQTESVALKAPPVEYSMIPESDQPYAVYNIRIQAPGYEPIDISGAEILSGQTALQNTSLLPLESENTTELYVIPPHTLYGDYPPKIPEEEVKPITQTGEIVLSRVVIPSGVRYFSLLKRFRIVPPCQCFSSPASKYNF